MVNLRSHILESHGGAEAITLENQLIRATLLPGLGGRIINLFDKRSGIEVFADSAFLGFGGLEEDVHSTFQTRSPSEENEPGAVSMFFLGEGQQVDTWVVVSLREGSPWLDIDVRHHNRSLRAAQLPQLVSLSGNMNLCPAPGGHMIVQASRQSGALVRTQRPSTPDGTGLSAVDVTPAVILGCRSIENTISLAPFGGLSGIHGVGTSWVASVNPDALEVVSQEDCDAVEVHVQMQSGETLKGTATLQATASTVISLSSLRGVQKAALVIAGQNTGWITTEPWQPGPATTPAVSGTSAAWIDEPSETAERNFDASTSAWETCKVEPTVPPTGIPGTEYLVQTIEALRACRMEQWSRADEAIDAAITSNGDDPLLWWAKAAVARHQSEDDNGALANAHYLSPMEPMLRVEGFLNQDQGQGAEANPLLAAVAADPAVALDCLARLAMWGFWTDFARLADDLLRHRDDAAVRYLLAWGLVRHTKMQATAAEHVTKAKTSPGGVAATVPSVFKTAIDELALAFPNDADIMAYLAEFNN